MVGGHRSAADSYAAFICHASSDRTQAEELAQHLEAMGQKCWIASRDDQPGNEYAEEILLSIANARYTVLLLSDAANESECVRREIEVAVRLGKPVFPVRLTKAILPSPALEQLISGIRWVDAWEDKWQEPAARLAAMFEGKAPAAPVSGRPWMWTLWEKRALRIFAYSLVGLYFLVGDVLGFGTTTGRYSEETFYNIIAPAYGTAPFAAPPGRSGPSAQAPTMWNRNISVILLDDKALRGGDKSGVTEGGIGWPAPMRYHVKLLSDLYETYHPAAIMVDILFFDKRPDDKKALEDFVDLIRKIKNERRTRLYLAASDPNPDTTLLIRELAKAADLVTVTWPEKDETNPFYYPLSSGAGDSPKPAWRGIRAGAAYTIYRDLCDRLANDKEAKNKWSGLNCPAGEVLDDKFERPMQIFWGIKAPALNWEQYNLGVFCAGQETFIPLRIWNLFVAGVTGSIARTRETCPYLQFLRARDFMDAGFRNDPYNHYEVKKTLDAAFGSKERGPPKIVFYGASFKMAEDEVRTPTHGRIPGVFMHAMALDNLLTLGDGYIREAADFDPVYLLLNWCLALFIAAIAVLAWDLHIRLIRRGRSALYVLPGSLAAGSFIIILAIYISFVLLRFDPVNWLGYFGVLAIIEMIQTRWVENGMKRALAFVLRIARSASNS